MGAGSDNAYELECTHRCSLFQAHACRNLLGLDAGSLSLPLLMRHTAKKHFPLGMSLPHLEVRTVGETRRRFWTQSKRIEPSSNHRSSCMHTPVDVNLCQPSASGCLCRRVLRERFSSRVGLQCRRRHAALRPVPACLRARTRYGSNLQTPGRKSAAAKEQHDVPDGAPAQQEPQRCW